MEFLEKHLKENSLLPTSFDMALEEERYESVLQERSTQLLKKAKKFKTGNFRPQKVYKFMCIQIESMFTQNVMYAVLAFFNSLPSVIV